MAGIYIHFPFCKKACHYCDFHFSTQVKDKDRLVNAICHELALQKNYLGEDSVETIYFGGGTPSLMNERELRLIFATLKENFRLENELEITLEANPDDLSEQNLFVFNRAGINRLSIGIQSFDDDVLRFLNRAHTGVDAIQSLKCARKAGFKNNNIDLIFAIPGQRNEQWTKNIHQAIELAPEHISCYSLTVEDKTVFGNWQKKGKLIPEKEEEAARQMETLMELLAKNGFNQYEISNFCKAGFHSRHNSNYWQQKKYLGVGPSAHSFDLVSRQFNVRNNVQYIKSIEGNVIPCEKEILTRTNKINEYIMTSLRTAAGCDLGFLISNHQFDLLFHSQKEVEFFLFEGLLHPLGNQLTLTKKGKLVADKIAADLFIDE